MNLSICSLSLSLPLSPSLWLRFGQYLPGGQNIRMEGAAAVWWRMCVRVQLFGGFTVAEEGWKVSFFPLFVSLFFFLLSVFECVSPEDGAASEQHISVNIRYLFPMPPVNTDKRQHCVVLWLHIPKDYAHFFSSLAFCVCSNTLFFLMCAQLWTLRCV